MFYVFKKDKILSYLTVGLCVACLLTFSGFISEKYIQTSSSLEKKIPIYNVDTDENKVAITFDCAWAADDIPKILQVLKDNNVKSTFFLVGDWIEKYPDTVKNIYEQGHDIANHSDTHAHVNNISYEKNIEEIKLCSDKIEKITGKKSYLYRGPYGEYNNTVMNAAEAQKHIVVQWDVDTLDWKKLTGDEMWKRIDKKMKKGSIILMHNGTNHTADSLDMLIKNIKIKGFEIIPVSELIYKDNYVIDSRGVQHKINQ